MTPIDKCPICGSTNVKRMREDLQLHPRERVLEITNLEVDHCMNCGEIFLDHEASQKIDSAMAKRRISRRRSA